jgi:plasmid stabilization system protein ParE
MLAELIITREARQDMAEAYDWYELNRTGLGEEFLYCVEACFEKIRRTPLLYTTLFKEYRRALPRRFPYAVFYEYSGNQVTVYAVFHTASSPSKWINRLS